MPTYQAQIYRKDADSKRPHPLGSDCIKAGSEAEARQRLHDHYWDEGFSLTGSELLIEMTELAVRLFDVRLCLVGPDGSRTFVSEEAVWATDEDTAMRVAVEQGKARIGKGDVCLDADIVGEEIS